MRVLRAYPLTLREANSLIEKWHRHHKPVRGQKYAIGAMDEDDDLVGAAVTGRPVARNVNYRQVAEVTRLVTNGFKNACSFLYASSARAAQAMGYLKIQTYILEDEDGTSLRAAGWEFEAWTSGGDWNRPSRGGRRNDQPTCRKQRWGRFLL